MSHLIWIYAVLQKPISSAVAVKELNPRLPEESFKNNSDHTEWMCRLILVFPWHTCNLLGNIVSLLICVYQTIQELMFTKLFKISV